MTKEQKKAYHRKWYLANRDKQIAAATVWGKLHPNVKKASKLKFDYNLSFESYNKMLIDQNYKCLLCDSKRKLVVDHNHNTGEVRGLLCNPCNLSLRHFENKERFEKILKYLQKQVALIS